MQGIFTGVKWDLSVGFICMCSVAQESGFFHCLLVLWICYFEKCQHISFNHFFKQSCLFCCLGVSETLHKSWILVTYLLCSVQKYCPILSVGTCLCWSFPLLCISCLVWFCFICLFCLSLFVLLETFSEVSTNAYIL